MNKWLLTMGLVGAAGQVFAAADTTSPTVTASPKSGTYSIAQSIKLAIKDNVDAAPVVYYTTDGTLPNKKSAIYKSQPINATDVKSPAPTSMLKPWPMTPVAMWCVIPSVTRLSPRLPMSPLLW